MNQLNLPLSVIVHGPRGCGLTRNAERIAEITSMETVVDNWDPSNAGMLAGHVYLTHAEPPILTELNHSVLLIPYTAIAAALDSTATLTDH